MTIREKTTFNIVFRFQLSASYFHIDRIVLPGGQLYIIEPNISNRPAAIYNCICNVATKRVTNQNIHSQVWIYTTVERRGCDGNAGRQEETEIFKQSTEARNRVGIGLSSPARETGMQEENVGWALGRQEWREERTGRNGQAGRKGLDGQAGKEQVE